MANTLTSLIPDLYQSLDIVSRELVGFIPAVALDASAERAAVNQAIRVFKTRPTTLADITPAMNVPNPADQTVDNVQIVITNAKAAEFGWTGEEQRGLNTGAGYAEIRNHQILQAMRTLTNAVEADIAKTYKECSRATGTGGTTPFADLTDPAQARKILADNGAPLSDMQMVIDTAAGAKLRTMANLTRANEAGTTSLREQGILLDLHGFRIRESAQNQFHTKGTGTGYLTNSASLTAGTTVIPVDTGTGTIVAGDMVTFAGDTNNKYLVTTALSGGSFAIAAPGLRVAIADNAAVTVNNNYTANMAFDRSAIQLVTRAPAVPSEGDLALDRTTITDPRSGLSFEVAMYPGYRKIRYEIALAWGVKLIKPEHTAILLG